jgi:carbon monoxide dehydrogenase subunit G
LNLKLSGSVTLPGTAEQAWALLTDPRRLAPLLPGCERLEPDGPGRYKATVKFGVAAISGKYAGSLEYSRMKPPRSLVLKLDGRGLPGFVQGQASIELLRKGSGTEVRYSGEAQVGGMIATVGQRLLEAAARKIVQQFFSSAAAQLESTAAAEDVMASPSVVAPNRKRR